MTSEVEIYNGEARTGSFLLAQGMDRPHDQVRKLIEKYRSDFEDFSVLKRRKLRSTGGRAANEYLLDEDQFMFLGTLLRNSKKVVAFKKAIVQQFKKTRKELESFQRHTEQPEYQITREAGKLVRRQTTDAIQEFIEYAESQGSENAGEYYRAITKMMNGLLFIVNGEFKVLRSALTIPQLMTTSSAEQIIDRGLRIGMSRKKYYKDIYQDVRAKVELFAELHGQSEVFSKQLSLF
jgi:phage regulator Rha-like protein